MPFVTIDGQPLHYIDQGTGPAVLLAGSYLWDQAMWAPQIAALSQQYRVIAPDLWGHGQSGPKPPATTSLDDIARQGLALLDHLDIERVTLVGLSVGGMWGARLALSAPGRINGLVLMDTYLGDEPVPTRDYYFSLLKQIEEIGVITPQLLDTIVPIFFHPDIDRESALYQDFRASLAALPSDRLRQSIVPMGRDHVWPGRSAAASGRAGRGDHAADVWGPGSTTTTGGNPGNGRVDRLPLCAGAGGGAYLESGECAVRDRGIAGVSGPEKLVGHTDAIAGKSDRRTARSHRYGVVHNIYKRHKNLWERAVRRSDLPAMALLLSSQIQRPNYYFGPRIFTNLSGDGAPCCCCSSPLSSI